MTALQNAAKQDESRQAAAPSANPFASATSEAALSGRVVPKPSGASETAAITSTIAGTSATASTTASAADGSERLASNNYLQHFVARINALEPSTLTVRWKLLCIRVFRCGDVVSQPDCSPAQDDHRSRIRLLLRQRNVDPDDMDDLPAEHRLAIERVLKVPE